TSSSRACPAPSMPSERYDVAVIGAGIVGLAVAREVLRRRPGSKVIVIDKHTSVGYHQTGHNSGVIHSGVYYKPGSLKARLCVQGARLMYDFCAVARAMEQELRRKDVTFALGCTISAVRREGGQSVVAHAGGSYRAGWSILCAGLWSDRLAVSAGAPPDPRIVPFRGAYLRLADGQPKVVRGMVYPVPDPELPFLGVHVTRHIDGHVMLGPTAMLAGARDAYKLWSLRPGDVLSTLSWPGTWIVAKNFWRTGISELTMAASRKAFVRAC